jgi:hypothetical protein
VFAELFEGGPRHAQALADALQQIASSDANS